MPVVNPATGCRARGPQAELELRAPGAIQTPARPLEYAAFQPAGVGY
ncbi:hypothetical protein [Microbulbifer halophilus]